MKWSKTDGTNGYYLKQDSEWIEVLNGLAFANYKEIQFDGAEAIIFDEKRNLFVKLTDEYIYYGKNPKYMEFFSSGRWENNDSSNKKSEFKDNQNKDTDIFKLLNLVGVQPEVEKEKPVVIEYFVPQVQNIIVEPTFNKEFKSEEKEPNNQENEIRLRDDLLNNIEKQLGDRENQLREREEILLRIEDELNQKERALRKLEEDLERKEAELKERAARLHQIQEKLDELENELRSKESQLDKAEQNNVEQGDEIKNDFEKLKANLLLEEINDNSSSQPIANQPIEEEKKQNDNVSSDQKRWTKTDGSNCVFLKENERWVELQDNEIFATFAEIEQNGTEVLLFDESRPCFVRLTDDKAFTGDSSDEMFFLCTGHW